MLGLNYFLIHLTDECTGPLQYLGCCVGGGMTMLPYMISSYFAYMFLRNGMRFSWTLIQNDGIL